MNLWVRTLLGRTFRLSSKFIEYRNRKEIFRRQTVKNSRENQLEKFCLSFDEQQRNERFGFSLGMKKQKNRLKIVTRKPKRNFRRRQSKKKVHRPNERNRSMRNVKLRVNCVKLRSKRRQKLAVSVSKSTEEKTAEIRFSFRTLKKVLFRTLNKFLLWKSKFFLFFQRVRPRNSDFWSTTKLLESTENRSKT